MTRFYRKPGKSVITLLVSAGLMSLACIACTASDVFSWPVLTQQTRPWTYWWWMGSAVDKTNITRELTRYRDAGLGGVHIIPIYGAKGFENKFIDYLSPQWMEMLRHTVEEGRRLGLGVDMTTGSGWCFGGPHVTDLEANASVICRKVEVQGGTTLRTNLGNVQAVEAFRSDGTRTNLMGLLTSAEGVLEWTPPEGAWTVYAISQKPSGQKVKRAGPGGQGHMLNLFYPRAMKSYLDLFETAFGVRDMPTPRAMYHDSYEYRCDWAPDLFASFEKRRGYRLQDELPAMFGTGVDPERAARVKCDYRETLSDIMVEETLPMWAGWAGAHGMITRNEAHGSPGNWLDLYATADIPETEMFYKDRNKLISKFASSAAHVSGKALVSSESGTWVKEHFTETLADVKYLFDDLFLSGVNHIFYHGTCYSPDEAAWPGWLFYASLEMNPRNSIWRDAPALNDYIARCQAVLQSGRPDNDVLIYWPLHDFWHDPAGLARNMSVHARDWFEEQPIGKLADRLWSRGYAFDYISDRQIAALKVKGQVLITGGNSYSAIVVPACKRMPVETLVELIQCASKGATVIFEGGLPEDVPGWRSLERRRSQMKEYVAAVAVRLEQGTQGLKIARLSYGRILTGDVEVALGHAGVLREPLFDQPGLMCIRRAIDGGTWYFVANRSEESVVDGFQQLARPAKTIIAMDPLTGRSGVLSFRPGAGTARPQVQLHLRPGQSIILRCTSDQAHSGPAFTFVEGRNPIELSRTNWQVQFIEGGPELPKPVAHASLGSWTQLEDPLVQSFAGTARYTTRFDSPDATCTNWFIDLGSVCQSARVRLNGVSLGTLIAPPFRVAAHALKPKDNVLEVEVTNLTANRIRDLDRRKVPWKTFYDINMVGLDYKPFDASNWPITDSGLLGPVTLTRLQQ